MVAELTDKHDPDWLSFWKERHPLALEKAVFDLDSPLHRVWCEWNEFGRIISAAVFVPMIRQGELLGHHAYLASYRRSKALITFSRAVMEDLRSDSGFGLVSVETHQSVTLRCIDKLAVFLGASPVKYAGMDYYDYIWNSKERTT